MGSRLVFPVLGGCSLPAGYCHLTSYTRMAKRRQGHAITRAQVQSTSTSGLPEARRTLQMAEVAEGTTGSDDGVGTAQVAPNPAMLAADVAKNSAREAQTSARQAQRTVVVQPTGHAGTRAAVPTEATPWTVLTLANKEHAKIADQGQSWANLFKENGNKSVMTPLDQFECMGSANSH